MRYQGIKVSTVIRILYIEKDREGRDVDKRKEAKTDQLQKDETFGHTSKRNGLQIEVFTTLRSLRPLKFK